MKNIVLTIASLYGMIAIILGAFGAHAFKKFLPDEKLASFEVGVRYQMYHALFLLFVGTTSMVNEKSKKIILNLVLIGVLFFSGSIYLLATPAVTSIDFRFLGPITPIGGLLLIAAWTVLFFNIYKQKT